MWMSKRRAAPLAVGLALVAASITAGPAQAVTEQVKNACKNDYFKFCPSHPVGSTTLRQCMRSVGKRLSSRCVDALVSSGEIRRPK